MAIDFSDLELLVQQPIDPTSADVLRFRMQQYQTASLEEIYDQLEGLIESYSLLQHHLPPALRQSGKREIEYLANLFQDRLYVMLSRSEPEPYQITVKAA